MSTTLYVIVKAPTQVQYGNYITRDVVETGIQHKQSKCYMLVETTP